MKKAFIFITLLSLTGLYSFAQPNKQQLEAQSDIETWRTNPPATVLLTRINGGGYTQRNAYGQIISTEEFGILLTSPCYFLTDRYSAYAQKLGPQSYMLVKDGVLYSLKRNRINPNCIKQFGWKVMPEEATSSSDYYTYETPVTYYRLNEQGKRVLKRDKFPEVIQKLFNDHPGYYEKYSLLCKEMNFNDPYYVSLLIEALIRYDNSSNYTNEDALVTFSATGFKAKSGKRTFRVLTNLFYDSPLEEVIPAGTETDKLNYYPQEKRSYSQRYLKQVEATRRIPQNYQGMTFDGEPVLLTDFYGFPAVFDNNKMYYLK